MYYSGTNNKTYKKYARYRDWLYDVDDMVERARGISLFELPDVPLRDWYEDGIGIVEAAERAIEMAN